MLTRDQYNKDNEYFMLTVYDKESIKFIRKPFLTGREVAEQVYLFQENNRYENIEVFNEKTLDMVVSIKNQNDHYEDLTLRSLLFGNLYEDNAIDLRS